MKILFGNHNMIEGRKDSSSVKSNIRLIFFTYFKLFLKYIEKNENISFFFSKSRYLYMRGYKNEKSIFSYCVIELKVIVLRCFILGRKLIFLIKEVV